MGRDTVIRLYLTPRQRLGRRCSADSDQCLERLGDFFPGFDRLAVRLMGVGEMNGAVLNYCDDHLSERDSLVQIQTSSPAQICPKSAESGLLSIGLNTNQRNQFRWSELIPSWRRRR